MNGLLASDLADSVDERFLVRYWVPAFVGLVAAVLLAGARAGGDVVLAVVEGLSGTGAVLLTLVLLLLVTVAAALLMGARGIVLGVAQGLGWPHRLVVREIGLQTKRRQAAVAQLEQYRAKGDQGLLARRAAERVANWFPAGPEVAPTVLANALLASEQYPWQAYGMPGPVWWPRLLAVAPSEYRESLDAAATPVIAMANLAAVLLGAAAAALALAATGTDPVAMLVAAVALVLLARGLYRAVCEGAVAYGQQVRVGFDLHRRALLEELGAENPSDPAAERALWSELTVRLEPVLAAQSAAPDAFDRPHEPTVA